MARAGGDDRVPGERGFDHVAILVPDRGKRVEQLRDGGWVLRFHSDRLSLLDPCDGRSKLTLVDAGQPTGEPDAAPLPGDVDLGRFTSVVAAVLPADRAMPIDHIAIEVDDLDALERFARVRGWRLRARATGPHVHSLFVDGSGGLLVEYVVHHTPFGDAGSVQR